MIAEKSSILLLIAIDSRLAKYDQIYSNQIQSQYTSLDADQGLLLQWAKYEKSDVTIVYYNRLERWSEISPRDHPIIGPIPVTEVPLPRRTKTIGLVDKSIDVVKSCGGSKMPLKRDYHIRECKFLIHGGTKRITNQSDANTWMDFLRCSLL